MGVTLIAIGLLFLLDRADVLDAGQVIGDWWPVVIVAFGLVTLAERPVSLLGPVLLVAVGVLLLLVTNDVLETSAWNVIWPSALIAFGLTVLFRNSRRGDHLVLGEGHDQDLVRTTAFLSGSELATQSSAFRGAVLTAIMGGVELDMRHATLAEDGAESRRHRDHGRCGSDHPPRLAGHRSRDTDPRRRQQPGGGVLTSR